MFSRTKIRLSQSRLYRKMAKIRLSQIKSSTFKISSYVGPSVQGFQIACRNDQDWNENGRPPHGIMCYVRDAIRVLEIQKRTCEEFEAIFICLQHTSLPIPVQLIIYVAPKCKYTQLIHELDELMRNSDDTCDTIFVGDFNMKSVTGMHHGYNRKLEYHMKNRFNFNQVIQEDTSNYSSVLDLCFTNANVQTSVVWNFWSDGVISK